MSDDTFDMRAYRRQLRRDEQQKRWNNILLRHGLGAVVPGAMTPRERHTRAERRRRDKRGKQR